MPKVTFNQKHGTTAGVVYEKGQTYDVPAHKVTQYIGSGLCRVPDVAPPAPVEPVAVAGRSGSGPDAAQPATAADGGTGEPGPGAGGDIGVGDVDGDEAEDEGDDILQGGISDRERI